MIVVLAEKSSVTRDIAAVLVANQNASGISLRPQGMFLNCSSSRPKALTSESTCTFQRLRIMEVHRTGMQLLHHG